MRKTACAGLLSLGLLLTGCGAAQSGSPAANRGSAAPARRVVTTFDGHAIWFTGDRSYQSGLKRLRVVTSPWSYESVALNQYGPDSLWYAARSGRLPKSGTWSASLRFGELHSFTVNGQRYQVPKAYAGMDIAVLPLQHGIVWLGTPPSGPANMVGPVLGTKNLNQAAFAGATQIYYTPYLPKGGSLLQGREAIASLPHRWTGLDGPVAASAWTGWLPKGSVRAPLSVSEKAHELAYSRAERLTGNRAVGTSLPGYPSLFLQQVGTLQAGKQPVIAWVQGLARTAGGFVLGVQFWDVNYGLDASGLGAADYYWSEAAGTWTPLTQIFMDQDIESFIDVGSRAVYWQQALAVPPGDGSRLDLVQLRFNPAADTIAPIWAGDYIYGQTFVDGASWIHDMLHLNHGNPNAPAVSVWTANTP